jgi:hypothetical protein
MEARAPGGYDDGGREEKDTALTASSQIERQSGLL